VRLTMNLQVVPMVRHLKVRLNCSSLFDQALPG
jgi:hypothetical protein